MTYFHMRDSHYHRRDAVSLLSSRWDQVVPTRYGRQTNKKRSRLVFAYSYFTNTLCLSPLCSGEPLSIKRVKARYIKSCIIFLSLDCFARARNDSIAFSVSVWFIKPLGCYMIKPHGQLVLVSFMHYCTSTSSLSTL